MRQALVPYLRTYDSRKQKCKHPRSKAEGGVGRLSAAGEGQHGERTTLHQCARGSKHLTKTTAGSRFFPQGIFSNSEISSHVLQGAHGPNYL